MTEYISRSTDRLSFRLAQGDTTVGTLIYNNRLSSAARIELPGNKIFKIESKGFFVKTFEIKYNGNALLTVKGKWNGNISIHTYFDNGKDFFFKRNSALKNTLVLVDSGGAELMVLNPGLNWSKLNLEYSLITADAFGKSDNYMVLLLTVIYCTNAFRAAMSGAIAGAGF